jgi:response regulator RpfG family c-di-GMP phosphodiesterase
MRLLLVDDDAALRELVRTTFELVDVEVIEAENADAAERALAESRPDIVVLDLGMPRVDGAELFERLRRDGATRAIPVIFLSGDPDAARVASELRVDAFLPKPFSPLQLLAVAERLAGSVTPIPLGMPVREGPEAQLLLYARDLRHLLELERGRHDLLQSSYREVVVALASALEIRTAGGAGHPERVRRYALELTRLVDPELLADTSLEHGFLLHDVGMSVLPDDILRKPSALAPDERRAVETHPLLGAQLVSGLSLLRGEGLGVVRSHHERWNGSGYPDRLRGAEIPVGARIFAVADALDAMLTGRPYREPVEWDVAAREIEREAGRQFDPTVVAAFGEASPKLQAIARSARRAAAAV